MWVRWGWHVGVAASHVAWWHSVPSTVRSVLLVVVLHVLLMAVVLLLVMVLGTVLGKDLSIHTVAVMMVLTVHVKATSRIAHPTALEGGSTATHSRRPSTSACTPVAVKSGGGSVNSRDEACCELLCETASGASPPATVATTLAAQLVLQIHLAKLNDIRRDGGGLLSGKLGVVALQRNGPRKHHEGRPRGRAGGSILLDVAESL